MVFSQALETYRERLNGDHSLKDRSKVYREERIAALLKSWPELEATDVAQISKSDCLSWAARFGQKASPSAFNNTVGTLKLVLDIAVEAGARYDNPVSHVELIARDPDFRSVGPGGFAPKLQWTLRLGQDGLGARAHVGALVCVLK